MRYLFCAPVTADFLDPLVGLALELRRRGHEAAFATGALAEGALTRAGLRRIPPEEPADTFRLQPWPVGAAVEAEVRHLEHAVRRFGPDVLVTNEITLSAFVVRERSGLPLCVLGAAEQVGSRAEGVHPLDRARAWFGLPPLAPEHPRFPLAGDLLLLRSTPELEGGDPLPPHVAPVGACDWEHAAPTPPEAPHGDRPLLVVEHRRIPQEPEFFPALVEGLGDRPVCVAAALASWDVHPALPAGWTAGAALPRAALLPRARLAVCGPRSALPLAALEHGVPALVVAGGEHEGEHVRRLVRAGCAARLDGGSLSAEALREGVEAALADERLRRAAADVGAGFARLRGFGAAADAVEGLRGRRPAAAGTAAAGA